MYVSPTLNFLTRTYGWVIKTGDNLQSVFLLLIRIIWGHQFFVAGYAQMHNWQVALNYYTTAYLAEFLMTLIIGIELIGGALLILGFASRLASIFLSLAMFYLLYAFKPEVYDWFHLVSDPTVLSHQDPFPFLLVSVVVFIFGPGRVSIDGWIKRRSAHWKQY